MLINARVLEATVVLDARGPILIEKWYVRGVAFGGEHDASGPTFTRAKRNMIREAGRRAIARQDARDVAESERRLIDPNEKILPFDQARRELGLE